MMNDSDTNRINEPTTTICKHPSSLSKATTAKQHPNPNNNRRYLQSASTPNKYEAINRHHQHNHSQPLQHQQQTYHLYHYNNAPCNPRCAGNAEYLLKCLNNNLYFMNDNLHAELSVLERFSYAGSRQISARRLHQRWPNNTRTVIVGSGTS
ncbi:hypothetical protein DPMN_084661 [Dreissena polymorpha]|uniref:Uncharacterized protein n=1 Tax=Dreissena polymorpha TaxID=45954 RepID=A0A9D3YEY9_DREPO|nr:hypothetical protein DPMN_084661 [Dreissena polymorpha]